MQSGPALCLLIDCRNSLATGTTGDSVASACWKSIGHKKDRKADPSKHLPHRVSLLGLLFLSRSLLTPCVLGIRRSWSLSLQEDPIDENRHYIAPLTANKSLHPRG
mmetsp:Transcript_12478/g.28930  ORF Transcript_12478/g.28930 Transcript_12478/m.28930 type:complete len:106 (-) Transcript_12478:20-337(-)